MAGMDRASMVRPLAHGESTVSFDVALQEARKLADRSTGVMTSGHVDTALQAITPFFQNGRHWTDRGM